MQARYPIMIVVLLALMLPAAPARAGGIVEVCDEAHLRAALAGGGTVTFTCSGTITLASEIALAADTTIDGSGQSVVVSGNHAVRVFVLNPTISLDLNALTIANGNSSGNGAGILNYGVLTMRDSTVSGNSGLYGGGILNDGTADLTNCIITGNSAAGDSDGGGGIANWPGGTLSVNNSTLSANRAAFGAAISNAGVLTVSTSIFSENDATSGGGGIFNGIGRASVSDSTFSGNSASSGAGIDNYLGWLTVSASIFTGNSADIVGGGITNNGLLTVTRVVFIDNHAATYDGGGLFNSGAETFVSDSTFSWNSANGMGGAVKNAYGILTVSHSTFDDNSAGDGGAIYNEDRLTASASTLTRNSADHGGGIYNFGVSDVSSSTFNANSAGFDGGALYNNIFTTTVSNSTLAGNVANDRGGGIYNSGDIYNRSAARVTNCTLAGNQANTGGGIYNHDGDRLGLANTIVANNSAGTNCSGEIEDGGGNLSYPDTTCPGSNGDPALGPLQNNGGPTQTMALGPGSAALDAADNGVCAAPPVNNLDQRGISRPQGPACDIGAYERESPTVARTGALRAVSAAASPAPAFLLSVLLVSLLGLAARRRQSGRS